MASIKNYLSFSFLILILIIHISPITTLLSSPEDFRLKQNKLNSSDWTVGVSIGDKRITNVTHCEGYCPR